jgi:hypothetical protein
MSSRFPVMCAAAFGVAFLVAATVTDVVTDLSDAKEAREEAGRWQKIAQEQSDAMRHLSDADAKLKAACMAPPAQ